MKTKMFNIIKIYFITDITMLHWGGPMFAHSPSNLVPLISQNLFAVEAKVLGLRMGVLAELRGQPHVSAVGDHSRTSVASRGFCCKVNGLQSGKSGQEVNLMRMMPQDSPHSE